MTIAIDVLESKSFVLTVREEKKGMKEWFEKL